MQCAKCGYVRQAGDTAPDYECPACGRVYAKTAAAPPPPRFAAIVDDAPPRPSAARLVVVAMIAVVVGSIVLGVSWGISEYRHARSVDRHQADLAQIEELVQRWDDAVNLAHSTARMALGDRIAAMQALHREARVVTLRTPCMKGAAGTLAQAMDLTIAGFIDFMGQRETDSRTTLTDAARVQAQFLDEARNCMANAGG